MKFRLVIAIFLLFLPRLSFAAETLLQAANLTYTGSFRVPFSTMANSCENSGGNGLITYNATNNSLFINGTDLNNTSCGSLAAVAEINIPSSLSSSTATDTKTFPATTFLQTYYDMSNGTAWYNNWGATWGNNSSVVQGGPTLIGSKIFNVTSTYYAADLHIYLFSHNLDLSSSSYDGLYGLKDVSSSSIASPRFYTYFLGSIPSEYQSRLGGDIFGGGGGGSVIGAASNAPSIFTFNSSSLGTANATSSADVGTGKLLLGNSINSSSTCSAEWPGCPGSTSPIGDYWSYIGGGTWSAVIVPGTQTMMVFGSRGWGACYPKSGNSPTSLAECSTYLVGGTAFPTNFGQYCYGGATANISEQCSAATHAGTWGPTCVEGNLCNGSVMSASDVANNDCCYDPVALGTKGGHAYPYVPTMWFYDIGNPDGTNSTGNNTQDNLGGNCNTLTAVALGSSLTACSGGARNPWDIFPYEVASLNLPWIPNCGESVPVGAAYDSTNKKLYVSMVAASDPTNSYHRLPVIGVYDVSTTALPAPAYQKILGNFRGY